MLNCTCMYSPIYTIHSTFIVIRIVSIESLQLLYHANRCNRVLQVLPTTSLVYIVFPCSESGICLPYCYSN